MSKELFTSNLTSLVKQLTRRKEIELIYYNIKELNGKQYINYTIICDVDSVVANIDLLKEIVANMEIAKTLYSKTNIIFNYNIKTSKAFEEDLLAKDTNTLEGLTNSNIIYSNNEYLENYLIEYADKEKSRH